MSNGYILWQGESRLLPGREVVVIATGFKKPSDNIKTGPMIQTWILDVEEKPTDAIKTGHDEGICGDCPFRGGVCYVQVGQAPNSVWSAYNRNGYPFLGREEYPEVFGGRRVRLGAYGDPVAAPLNLWRHVVDHAVGHTGYTHQWRRPEARGFEGLCMASTDSLDDTRDAQSLGFRTFRVAESGGATRRSSRLEREVVCPASDEAGKLVTCHDCLACGGVDRGQKSSIVIGVHGSAASVLLYNELQGGGVG